MIIYLAIGTIPAVVLGLSFKDFFENALQNELLASFMLCVTGLLLVLPRWVSVWYQSGKNGDVGLPSAIIMGIGQAVAILPGISRSGSTIAAGMMAGVKPSRAAEFSFLLAIPVIAGGAVFKFKDFGDLAETSYYSVLGVDKEADQAEISLAFEKIRDQPDADPDQVSVAREAYSVLSDSKRRESYDSTQPPFLPSRSLHHRSGGPRSSPVCWPSMPSSTAYAVGNSNTLPSIA